jgi:hypothetical protein
VANENADASSYEESTVLILSSVDSRGPRYNTFDWLDLPSSIGAIEGESNEVQIMDIVTDDNDDMSTDEETTFQAIMRMEQGEVEGQNDTTSLEE